MFNPKSSSSSKSIAEAPNGDALPTIGSRAVIKVKNGILTGTVAFAGKTQFALGDWIGVALDTCNGKNDGAVKDVRYFYCKEDHGLFLPPKAVCCISANNIITQFSGEFTFLAIAWKSWKTYVAWSHRDRLASEAPGELTDANELRLRLVDAINAMDNEDVASLAALVLPAQRHGVSARNEDGASSKLQSLLTKERSSRGLVDEVCARVEDTVAKASGGANSSAIDGAQTSPATITPPSQELALAAAKVRRNLESLCKERASGSVAEVNEGQHQQLSDDLTAIGRQLEDLNQELALAAAKVRQNLEALCKERASGSVAEVNEGQHQQLSDDLSAIGRQLEDLNQESRKSVPDGLEDTA